ncbi:nucleotide-binding protein [Nannocystaceae bacterium ST9]
MTVMACVDEGGPAPVDELACDIPRLFEERCGGSICHADGESTAAGLDLVSPGVEQRVAGAPGSSCVGLLADPSDPEASLLYTKVTDAPGCGTRMPLNGEPLDEDELTCMRDWISGLLPPSADDGCADCTCEPGASESCYFGPEGTADLGVCVSGIHTCQTSGMAWSACEGEIGPRGEDCYTPELDENCDGSTPACSETWALGFGDDRVQATRSVAFDPQGNVIALGDFEGEVGYGGAPLIATASKADLVVSKHDVYGNPIWSVRAGDSSNQYGAKLIVDGEGSLILLARTYGSVDFGGGPRTAKGAGDLLVVKLDGEGRHLWSRIFGSSDPERAERVVVDAQGDVFLTGTFTSTVDFGGGVMTSAGMRDAFVVKLDGTTGDHLYSRRIGGPGDDYGFGIDVAEQARLVIAGRFQASIELGQTLISAGGKDIYLAELDEFGLPNWSRSFGGEGDDEIHDLRVQANGDLVLLGSMSATIDFGGGALVSAGLRDMFVATLDGQGNHVWSTRHGDALDQFTSPFEINSWLTLALGPSGTIHVGGSLIGALEFESEFGSTGVVGSGANPDVFHVELAADGTYLDGSRYGGTNTDLALDIAVNEAGYVLLGGRAHSSELAFGAAGSIRTWGGGDGFIAKLPPG